MDVIEQLKEPAIWQAFLDYKRESRHISGKEEAVERALFESEKYSELIREMMCDTFVSPIPQKREINKQGTKKKRVIYTFEPEMNQALKLMTWLLYRYDDRMADNCYAFRRHKSVQNAIFHLKRTSGLDQMYCLKVDIHNYFNSIDAELLLERLQFLRKKDGRLYTVIQKILCADAAYEGDVCIHEKRGAMAGVPVSVFLANVYLTALDWSFQNAGASYFRYSDDILIFAETEEQLEIYKCQIYGYLQASKLTLNETKTKYYLPGEAVEFLGISYKQGTVRLSEMTKDKLKGKIRRKARALRRWSAAKNLSYDKAAIGFVRAVNHKLYDKGIDREFCWSRWFFPLLTTTEDLKALDAYIQLYIRYCVTGRHQQANYRISYEQLKCWGYKSLVNSYYKAKEKTSFDTNLK